MSFNKSNKEVEIKLNQKRNRMKRSLRENFLDSILESIQEGISVLDADLNIQYANKTIKKWYKEALPLGDKKCYQVYQNRKTPCDNCPSLRCMETGKMQKREIKNPVFSLTIENIEIFSYPLRDEITGEITGVVQFIRDITEQKRIEKENQYTCFHDELTGLYNRSYLEEEMKRLDTVRQLPISIVMIDLNGLKLVNDIFGHEEGDQLLVKTAEVLEDSCRKEDILARFGGDEFILLLPRTKRREAEKIRERIKKNCQLVAGLSIPLSMAVGTATKKEEIEDLRQVRRKADDRMYHNKINRGQKEENRLLNNLLEQLKEESAENSLHALQMQKLSFQLGERIGLSVYELERLSLLASFHDIGKIVVPDEILFKEASLTEEEWKRVKNHSKAGYRIASATERFVCIADEILYHHEHWDGGGYPEGLKEGEIPLLSRIINIVDAYEVMQSGRPYKEAMGKREIIKEFQKKAGSQFDPELVEVFLELIQ